jgi:hypothetical protein
MIAPATAYAGESPQADPGGPSPIVDALAILILILAILAAEYGRPHRVAAPAGPLLPSSMIGH